MMNETNIIYPDGYNVIEELKRIEADPDIPFNFDMNGPLDADTLNMTAEEFARLTAALTLFLFREGRVRPDYTDYLRQQGFGLRKLRLPEDKIVWEVQTPKGNIPLDV